MAKSVFFCGFPCLVPTSLLFMKYENTIDIGRKKEKFREIKIGKNGTEMSFINN